LLEGGETSEAKDINNNGQVVGYTSGLWTYSRKAFIWDSTNGMRDLNSLIPPDSAWLLQEATGINDFGQITGYGLHDGKTRAFLLTPQVQTPVIFVPGITGSELAEEKEDGTLKNVWLGNFLDSNHRKLILDPRPITSAKNCSYRCCAASFISWSTYTGFRYLQASNRYVERERQLY